MNTEDKDDTILLEQIEILKKELKEKDRRLHKVFGKEGRLDHHIFAPFRKHWNWWWTSEPRQGLTFVFLILTLVFWIIGGWKTDHFYIDSCNCDALGAGKLGVYQEYTFGKDERILSCRDMEECVTNLKKHKEAWNKYKQIENNY